MRCWYDQKRSGMVKHSFSIREKKYQNLPLFVSFILIDKCFGRSLPPSLFRSLFFLFRLRVWCPTCVLVWCAVVRCVHLLAKILYRKMVILWCPSEKNIQNSKTDGMIKKKKKTKKLMWYNVSHTWKTHKKPKIPKKKIGYFLHENQFQKMICFMLFSTWSWWKVANKKNWYDGSLDKKKIPKHMVFIVVIRSW